MRRTAETLLFMGYKSLVDFVVGDQRDDKGKTLTWLSDQPEPTEQDLEAALAALEAEEAAQPPKRSVDEELAALREEGEIAKARVAALEKKLNVTLTDEEIAEAKRTVAIAK